MNKDGWSSYERDEFFSIRYFENGIEQRVKIFDEINADTMLWEFDEKPLRQAIKVLFAIRKAKPVI